MGSFVKKIFKNLKIICKDYLSHLSMQIVIFNP